MPHRPPTAHAVIVGAGLAGLVAACELIDAGKRVVIVEQESEANLGGQAFWSFGGIFLIDSPEQRRLGVHDSLELARSDWLGTAGFDRPEDYWPRKWAEAYLQFAAGEQRNWMAGRGIRLFPIVGWAERGGGSATGQGNSVPRFHIAWGTGPAVIAPFVEQVREGVRTGQVELLFRHRVDELVTEGGRVVGVTGTVLAPHTGARGTPSNSDAVGDFDLRGHAVVVTSGGMGGNHNLIRAHWPKAWGVAPQHMLSGVPAHVDGRMLGISAASGARLINQDRMWHYTEGITNYDPVWARHGIRILPGPSSLWLDATGARLPAPLFPGFDTRATLERIVASGYSHSWFVLSQKIIEKEFALSGSEQNPDLTGKDLRLLAARVRKGAPGPVELFKQKGADFVVANTLDELIDGMTRLSPEAPLDAARVRHEVEARDRQVGNRFSKDAQFSAIRQARNYIGDKLLRVARPHRLQDPKAGPLIAVKLHILTRKSLGGIETNLSGQALDRDGQPIPGLYAAGEASGFGGGGMHGYRSLEGTFLGGCLFSGRQVGHAVSVLTTPSSPSARSMHQ